MLPVSKLAAMSLQSSVSDGAVSTYWLSRSAASDSNQLTSDSSSSSFSLELLAISCSARFLLAHPGSALRCAVPPLSFEVIDAAREIEPHHDIGGAVLLGLLFGCKYRRCVLAPKARRCRVAVGGRRRRGQSQYVSRLAPWLRWGSSYRTFSVIGSSLQTCGRGEPRRAACPLGSALCSPSDHHSKCSGRSHWRSPRFRRARTLPATVSVPVAPRAL
jgi:hypothetical protein